MSPSIIGRGPFFNLFQKAITTAGSVDEGELYTLFWVYAWIGMTNITLFVLTRFFVSHYIFRWRTAMNDYYIANWARLRHIEGASQRVQEDTMRFATTMEGLGVALIDSAMTLIAFLPLLAALSVHVPVLPLVGEVPYSLVFAAVTWSIFGTVLLMVAGIKLPGLEFRNQRVEAAYRKELVYRRGRCQTAPARRRYRSSSPTCARIISDSIFTMPISMSFAPDICQADAIFSSLILIPTIVAGKITLGIWQQIATAFGQVSSVVPVSGYPLGRRSWS